MAHSIFSPSSAHRWIKCHLSVALKTMSFNPTSEFASEGKGAHESAYRILSTNSAPTPDEDFAVVTYVEYVRDIMSMDPTSYAAFEKKVDLSPLTGLDDYGTIDAVVVGNSTINIIDFKYGEGIGISAFENMQLMMYLCAETFNLPQLARNGYNLRLHVVQPRNPIGITTYDVSWEEVDEFVKLVQDTVEAIKGGSTWGCMGAHCQFCPVLHICPLQYKALTTAVPILNDGSLLSISNDKLIGLLDKIDDLKYAMKLVKDEATDRLYRGEELHGYKLTTTKRRYIADDSSVATYLLSHGASWNDIYKTELVGFTELDKVCKRHNIPTGSITGIAIQDSAPYLSKVKVKGKETDIARVTASDFD